MALLWGRGGDEVEVRVDDWVLVGWVWGMGNNGGIAVVFTCF